MSIAITELELTDINTISIPTDAILMISLLIIFALIGYFFQNTLNTHTNQFFEKVDDHSNIGLIKEKLKDQFIIVDTEELHQYLKDNRSKVVHLWELISKLEWNIILPKN